MLDRVLEAALEKSGSSKALAADLDISPPELTRFRSGEIGLKVKTLNRLFEISGLKIGPVDSEKKLKTALKIMSELYLEADKK